MSMLADGAVVLGIGCIAVSAYYLHPAAAIAVLGVSLIAFGVLLSK